MVQIQLGLPVRFCNIARFAVRVLWCRADIKSSNVSAMVVQTLSRFIVASPGRSGVGHVSQCFFCDWNYEVEDDGLPPDKL